MGLYDDLRWYTLTEPEKTLAECVRDGKVCDFQNGKKFDAKDPKSWDGQPEIRGRVIAALAIGELKDKDGNEIVPTLNGIVLLGARNLDGFDLSDARIEFPLVISQSLITGVIDISRARLSVVALLGSRIEGIGGLAIRGDGFRSTGSLVLRETVAVGEVRLLRADIGGSLECAGAAFENEGGRAVSADGMKTGGNALFVKATAKGEFRLLSVDIGGSLECAEAAFKTADGEAFNADRMKTGGNARFQKATAKGEFRLLAADIGGSLYCMEATFENVGSDAISADGMKTGGDARFDEATAKGEFRLLSANIGRNLECNGAAFENTGRKAFSADGVKTGGTARFEKATAKGEFRLLGADIGGNLYCEGSVFENEDKIAFGADRMKTGGNVHFVKATAKGEFRLLAADIGGDFVCMEAAFENTGGSAFTADRMKTGGAARFEKATAKGEFRLLAADIGVDLVCIAAAFENEGGEAFNAQNAVVEMNFFWRNMKEPKGTVDLSHMHVGVLADDSPAWAEKGKLLLDGFEYGAIAPDSPKDSKSRLEWLGLLPSKKYTPQPYRQLAKVLRQMGYEIDARKISIARMDTYRDRGVARPLHKAWLRFLKKTVGYGHEPWEIWKSLVVFMAIGLLFFGIAYHRYGVIVPAKEEVYLDECFEQNHSQFGRKGEKDCSSWVTHELSMTKEKVWRLPPEYPEFSSFWYSLDTLLPVVDLHQESYWLPDRGQDNEWNWARIYLWAHILIGWLLSSVFLAALAGIVKDKDD